MKKIVFLLLLLMPSGLHTQLYAQTDRELLLELVKQQVVTNVKIDKLAEQQIATTAEIKGIVSEIKGVTLEIKGISSDIKAMQKQIEMLFTLVMVILAGIFGLVVMIFWDRRAAMRPIEAQGNALKLENEALAKEVALLKERETKLEEKQLKNENIFKKLLEKFPDLASLT